MTYWDHEHEADSRDDPCEAVLGRRDGSDYLCGRPWTSAVHPPDQYRHWCSVLEAGGDCMHFEEDYA